MTEKELNANVEKLADGILSTPGINIEFTNVAKEMMKGPEIPGDGKSVGEWILRVAAAQKEYEKENNMSESTVESPKINEEKNMETKSNELDTMRTTYETIRTKLAKTGIAISEFTAKTVEEAKELFAKAEKQAQEAVDKAKGGVEFISDSIMDTVEDIKTKRDHQRTAIVVGTAGIVIGATIVAIIDAIRD